jgi:hypothetical protein
VGPRAVWTGQEISLQPGFDPQTVQSVASRYTDCATPAHFPQGKQAKELKR